MPTASITSARESAIGTSNKKWKREKKYLKKGDAVVGDGSSDDQVVAVMGPTGVGKSTFINTLLGEDKMEVGHTLTSCTKNIQHALLSPGLELGYGRRIILDTPGFDDTFTDDAEILRRISVWLATSYVKDMHLAGVLYLADISQPRMHGSVRENIDMMKELCGQEKLKSVICVTTKWTPPSKDSRWRPDSTEVDRENQLREKYFEPLLSSGAKMKRFNGTKTSAQEIIEEIFPGRQTINDSQHALAHQRELVDYSMYIPETSAGKKLKITLEEFLQKRQKKKVLTGDEKNKIAKKKKAVRELETSIMAKIKHFFTT